ncbi:MAG: hypothetical protein KKC03_02175 [Bacteroidetes bacterium]|nr:hypothetical protein [Bacteroidota bacterium]
MADFLFYGVLTFQFLGFLLVVYLFLYTRQKMNAQPNREILDMYYEVNYNCSGKDYHKCVNLFKKFRKKIMNLVREGRLKTSVDMYNAAYVIHAEPVKFVNGRLDEEGKDACYLAYSLSNNALLNGIEEARFLSLSIYDRILLYKNQNCSLQFPNDEFSESVNYVLSKMDNQEELRKWINTSDTGLKFSTR